jgi:putative transposase
MNDTQLLAFVTSHLPSSLVLEHARRLHIIRRHSKFDLVLFVWVFIVCSFNCSTASLAHLERCYTNLAKRVIARSTFYARITDSMAQLFESLFDHLLARQAAHGTHWIHEHLDLFHGVLAIDSSTIQLRRSLNSAFRACQSHLSALKLHAVYNVLDFQLHHIRLSCAKDHDILGVERVASFCRKKLLLFDLGYYSHQVFATIDKSGGYFISRLKDNAEPRVLEQQSCGSGRYKKLAGKPLKQVLKGLKRQWLDVQVELGRGKDKLVCRVVGGRHQDGGWRLYVTNLSSEQIEAREIIELYRVRWQVELLFKQLKSRGFLDEMMGKSVAAVKIQMYATLMGFVMCGLLVEQVRKGCGTRQVSMSRALEAWRVLGMELLQRICGPGRLDWMQRFERMSLDPNVERSRYLDPLIRTSSLSY